MHLSNGTKGYCLMLCQTGVPFLGHPVYNILHSVLGLLTLREDVEMLSSAQGPSLVVIKED